ncbi:MAG: hypothetical protein IT428_22295 [Planctomycetaceae bacterium]|nr:hypothetical protein [Planctomycetaceae bacterium]
MTFYALRYLLVVTVVCFFCRRVGANETPPVSGDSTIRGRFGSSDIVITTTNRLAGAIHSLTWNGREFIDSFDHGRQLQSASNLACGKEFFPETFNPTEAGSRRDGAGPKSSSRLLEIRARDNELFTRTRMAFWLVPGEKSGGHPAANTTALSDHLLEKRVRIGHAGLPNAIAYDVTFTLPEGEHHTYAQFEAVTGYMPAAFDTFWKFDATASTLRPLDDGPGEQPMPVVLSTASGSHAMGIYSPDQPSKSFEAAGYGRWRFRAEKVMKWNCVFRIQNEKGVPAGDYRFRNVVVVGTREDVVNGLKRLTVPGVREE